ncbi:hypothetical protein JNM05_14480 [bacterium]|nr:hypothetical protein [bacterium]
MKKTQDHTSISLDLFDLSQESVRKMKDDLRVTTEYLHERLDEKDKQYNNITREFVLFERRIAKLESRQMQKNDTAVEEVDISGLYGAENKISKAVTILSKSLVYLQNSIDNFEDELTKESQMSLVKASVYELVMILASNKVTEITNRDTILSNLRTALYIKFKSHEPFTKSEINSLYKIISLLRNNIVEMTDNVFFECIDMIENHFSIGILNGEIDFEQE